MNYDDAVKQGLHRNARTVEPREVGSSELFALMRQWALSERAARHRAGEGSSARAFVLRAEAETYNTCRTQLLAVLEKAVG